MTIQKLPGSQIASNTITITQIQTTAVTSIVTQIRPRVSSLIYPGDDTAGNTVGGQTVYINGSGFQTNNAIYINGNAVPSKTFISASNLSFTTPVLSTGIYPVYVINTDSGATAIFVPGYVSSAEPAWATSAGSLSVEQNELTAWSYSLSATGDAPITYALAGGSSLPSGISLAANGVVSGTLSSPPGIGTTYTFSVVAADAENQDSTRQFTVTTTAGEGILFANNVLLIHANGTNNKNNHTFLDSSNNNFTITRNGNANQGSFSPYSQTGWSGYFDGTGDYLSVSDNEAFNFTGDFTIECWLYPTSHPDFVYLIGQVSTTDYAPILVSIANGRPALSVSTNGSTWAINSPIATAIPLITWSHIAVVRSGNKWSLYVNGVENVIAASTAVTPYNSTDPLSIGGEATGPLNYPYFGYISNLRILKGTALYTANSSPPTAALTNIANTSLLTLQSNRFIDNSNNNFAITRTGDVSIQAFAPFAPTAAYSTANVGGSVYVDGTSDSLGLSVDATPRGTEDFTIELWFYPLSIASAERYFIGGAASGSFLFGITNYGNDIALIQDYIGSMVANFGSRTQLTASAWNHIAVTRNGNSFRCFINGVLSSSGVVTSSYSFVTPSSTTLFPGSTFGYVSDMRVNRGTAVYTAAFTPPTAPLTNIANTSLLCNFTNAGIFDQTAKNVLETVGDAKVSTAQYKYGTGSMYFDGTGDYLSAPDNPLLELESGDFTIEAWIYVVSYVSGSAIITKGTGSASFLIYIGGTSEISFYASTTGSSWAISDLRFATNPATSTWHHIAVTRSGSTVRTFFNGTLANSTTLSGSLFNNSNPLFVGYYGAGFNGYIDDLRITKGYARYTSTFTPPTSALKDS